MAQELQKQSSEMLTFQKQPAQFLAKLSAYFEMLQKVYRSKLPPDELKIWAETLKDFSFQEFDQAMKHMIANPPKYEIDGEIQVWRGLPKLPDVIGVMLDFREQRAVENRRQDGRRLIAEMRDLEARRAAGEQFYGLKEVFDDFRALEASKTMPANEDREAELAAQKKELLKEKS